MCIRDSSLPVLIILYHACSLLDINYCLFACSCISVITTRFSIYAYNLDSSKHICLSMYATWYTQHHSLGGSDSPGSSCLGLRAWSLWILLVADQSDAAEAWINERRSEPYPSRAPCSALEFSCYNYEPSFVQLMIVNLFVFSHLRLSVIYYSLL